MTTEEIDKASRTYASNICPNEYGMDFSGERASLIEAFIAGAKLVNKYSQEKQKENIEKLFLDWTFINNVCLSFRHDYGLLDDYDRNAIRFECREWFRAILNNWKEIE